MEILGLILAIYFGVRVIITGAEIGIFMNPELSKTVIEEIMTQEPETFRRIFNSNVDAAQASYKVVVIADVVKLIFEIGFMIVGTLCVYYF
ncbi:MAG: hypothetical protein KBT06_04330 [Prevotellaceae bacterium]|nr:hypothetical protein [Candidatus Colivivens equi]